ncbi:MAG: F0F1 ATP synthase subunit delta [Chloroflexi bacterium]|nr:F0F1 ATP synthase subunit delta [Chloroflexota bacterium]
MARRTSAARRYAEAAFQLADRDDALDAWGDGLALAARLLSDERVLRIVDSPARPYRSRLDLIEDLLRSRVPEGVLKLAALLAQKGRIERLPEVVAEYRRLLDRRRGVVEARVTSAAPLTADETEQVRDWITRLTGQAVDLQLGVDEDLIGGLTVRVGDTLLDASVRGRLERLRNQLIASR